MRSYYLLLKIISLFQYSFYIITFMLLLILPILSGILLLILFDIYFNTFLVILNIVFWKVLIFISILFIFTFIHSLGFNIICRRIQDYQDYFYTLNFLSSIGSFISIISFIFY